MAPETPFPSSPLDHLDPEGRSNAALVIRASMRLRDYLCRGLQMEPMWEAGNEPTMAQLKTMMVLRNLGPSTLKGLSEALGVSGPSASAMVDKLVESGFVTRTPDAEDRRRVTLALSPDAARRVEAHESFFNTRMVQLLERLGPEAVQHWVQVSTAVLEALDGMDGQQCASSDDLPITRILSS